EVESLRALRRIVHRLGERGELRPDAGQRAVVGRRYEFGHRLNGNPVYCALPALPQLSQGPSTERPRHKPYPFGNDCGTNKAMARERQATKAARRAPKPLDAARLDELALTYVARFATSAAKLERYLKRKLRERGW